MICGGMKSAFALIAVGCLWSSLAFSACCDNDDSRKVRCVSRCERAVACCPSYVSEIYYPSAVYRGYYNVMPDYNYSYDTGVVHRRTLAEAGSREFSTRYSQEPGLDTWIPSEPDIAVREWSDEGRRVDFAIGIDEERGIAGPRQRDRGLTPAQMSQSYETRAERQARIDRETSASAGADDPQLHRREVDRSRFVSRDDIRDDDRYVDPTFGRGATAQQGDLDNSYGRDANFQDPDMDVHWRRDATNVDAGAVIETGGTDTGR